MTPQGNQKFKLDQLYNKNEQSIEVAPGSGHEVKTAIELPANQDLSYALLMRDFK